MIPTLDTSRIDLGKDQERISPNDAARQTATVNQILRAFFGPRDERCEVQLLADEVGMGKTFVALAVGYAILSVLRDTARAPELEELADCYRCILVLTPGGNPTLASKWDREDEALLTRCARDGENTGWFRSVLCESSDQLLQNILRADDRRRRAPVILVAQSSIFTKRLSDPAVRFVSACLFRWWGKGLQMRERYHIIRGLSETVGSGGWEDAAAWAGRGEYDIDLWDWRSHERFLAASDRERESWEPRWQWRMFKDVSVTYADMQQALDRLSRDGGQEPLKKLRELCQDVPTRRPSDRRTTAYGEWLEWFRKLKGKFRDVFKQLWPFLLRKRFPLVISDEAHHWRNNETGDFRSIREFIAPHARRMLLLTATPFQLNPQETVNVLNVVDHMEPAIGADRVAELQRKRDRLAQCMEASARAGRDFSREWGSLADQMARWKPLLFEPIAILPGLDDPRPAIIAQEWSRIVGFAEDPAVAMAETPGPLKPFFKRAVELRNANESLERAMRPLVIRHRRCTQHRHYWVGREYPPVGGVELRPDQNRLHLAPGQALEPADELIQYLLMKVVAAASQGRHRAALGTALTGCYSTMWESQEGRKAIEAAADSNTERAGLLALLQRLTGKGNRVKDAGHPKLRRVVDAVMERWDRGEKSLIFCFRVPTAQALYQALSRRIEDQLKLKRTALFRARGTEIASDEDRDKAMQAFRRSLTARESSGVPLFLDRVLIGWFLKMNWPVPELTQDDLKSLAALAARAQLRGRMLFPDMERPDRVFLQRAIEHVWARRLLASPLHLPPLDPDRRLAMLLEQMAQESWVRDRYGVATLSMGGNTDDTDTAERSVRSSLAAHYDLVEADSAHVNRLEQELLTRHASGRDTVLTALVQGPNLLGAYGAVLDGLTEADRNLNEQLREAMFDITLRKETNGEDWNWAARSTAIDAITRALLRDDILLRMPTAVFSGHDETWATSLFRGFHQPISASHAGETLAQRIYEFLREIGRMSSKEREDYLDYAMNPRAEAVALVQGGTKSELRNAIFCGFNTPLLPEILVCTSVGQEGIDLHRECSHVIHYDLGWNPATIEQRTGRTDRIGSKAERDRRCAIARQLALPGLDVALPYLAATYDERIFDVLRTRAQIFEILTGGDPTADRDGDAQWVDDDEGSDADTRFIPLPQSLLEDLRVELSVVP